MRTLGAASLLLLSLGGCATQALPSACPPGQTQVRVAQVFLGARPPVKLDPAEIARFVDQEVTPRFPDGVSVVNGGDQWKGAENQIMREASKVLLIVLPTGGGGHNRLDAIRAAYRTRFSQDSAVFLPPPTCSPL